VGLTVAGFLVGAGEGEAVAGFRVGFDVGGLTVGSLDGLCVVGRGLGAEVVGDIVDDSEGDSVVGNEVAGCLLGDAVMGDRVGIAAVGGVGAEVGTGLARAKQDDTWRVIVGGKVIVTV